MRRRWRGPFAAVLIAESWRGVAGIHDPGVDEFGRGGLGGGGGGGWFGGAVGCGDGAAVTLADWGAGSLGLGQWWFAFDHERLTELLFCRSSFALGFLNDFLCLLDA